MLYAHAATKMLLAGGDLLDGNAVSAAVRNTSFMGVGGSDVTLNNHGDRIESTMVMNYVLTANGVMSSVVVGLYSCSTGQYKAYDQAVVWPGNSTETPPDHGRT